MPLPPSLHRRPHILQVVSHLALGGAERVALNIAQALRQDFDFSLYAVRGVESGELGAALRAEVSRLGFPLHLGARVPMRFGGVITSGIGLTRAVRRVQPDLIHLHTEIPEAACATMSVIAPSLRAIPVVRTIHNTVFWKFWRGLGCWCDRRLAAAYVVGVSDGCVGAFERLREDSRGAGPPEKPVTIFNGVPFRTTERAPRPASAGQPMRLIFGGRLEEQKGTDLLPEILLRARPPARGAHLVIYGSGSHEPLLRTLTRNPPAGWSIELRSPVRDFVQRLDEHDLVLMPSRYEGLALVAIEAALAGIPVVGTDAAGLRDAFPADHPWLARAGDAADFAAKLQHALDRPGAWQTTAQRARAFAETHFSVDAMAAAYRALYRRALPEPAFSRSSANSPHGLTP